jgi:hypothetical protein
MLGIGHNKSLANFCNADAIIEGRPSTGTSNDVVSQRPIADPIVVSTPIQPAISPSVVSSTETYERTPTIGTINIETKPLVITDSLPTELMPNLSMPSGPSLGGGGGGASGGKDPINKKPNYLLYLLLAVASYGGYKFITR